MVNLRARKYDVNTVFMSNLVEGSIIGGDGNFCPISTLLLSQVHCAMIWFDTELACMEKCYVFKGAPAKVDLKEPPSRQ